jgi:glucose/arabinose dehydrogenase
MTTPTCRPASPANSLQRLRRWRARAAVVAGLCAGATAGAAPQLDKLRVPDGFRVELLTDAVPNARQMTLGRSADGKGIVYVGSASAGKVYAVEYEANGRANVRTIAAGLQLPTGVAYRDGALFVGALARVLRYDGIDDKLTAAPAPVLVSDRFPSDTHHGRRFIAFGPDGKLYVPVGAPCNICLPDERHGVIQRMNVDGSAIETVARRRSQFGRLRLEPGRPHALVHRQRPRHARRRPAGRRARSGDAAGRALRLPVLPPGRLARSGVRRAARVQRVHRAGGQARRPRRRPRHALLRRCAVPGGVPRQHLHRRARLVESQQEERLQVVRVAVDAQGRAGAPEPFLQGFLQVDASGRETVWGRPADVLPLPDGSLLVSDDLVGAIYRVRYSGP